MMQLLVQRSDLLVPDATLSLLALPRIVT